jgi:hypothetical protein
MDKHDQGILLKRFFEKFYKNILNNGLFVMSESWIGFHNIHIFTVTSNTTNKLPVAVQFGGFVFLRSRRLWNVRILIPKYTETHLRNHCTNSHKSRYFEAAFDVDIIIWRKKLWYIAVAIGLFIFYFTCYLTISPLCGKSVKFDAVSCISVLWNLLKHRMPQKFLNGLRDNIYIQMNSSLFCNLFTQWKEPVLHMVMTEK